MHASKPFLESKLAILGGNPHCDGEWSNWPIHDKREEQALLDVLHSGKWWFGERVKQFEAEYASFQGAQFAVSCTNGTSAIEMGLRALGVVPGDEVIVPPYTFIATASAVVTIGATPVFADICPETLCIDPGQVKAKITDRTKAIVPVHVAGRISDMDAINRIAHENQLEVLEDSAHAWGSQLNGRGAGTLGRCGTFSFQETKNMTAGEGGILVTDDEELAELCRSFSHCGRVTGSAWYDHDVLGSNLRLTEFQAAVLSAQLSRLPEQIARREQNAAILDEMLGDVPGIRLLAPAPEMTRRSYHMYIFRLDTETLGVSRDRMIEALAAEGVAASAGWYRPIYGNKLFREAHLGQPHGIRKPLAGQGVDYSQTHCDVCEQVCQDAIWLAHYLLLAAPGKIKSVGEAIAKVVHHADQL